MKGNGQKTNMKSTIYYFSGTGNSLDIARKIAVAIEAQTELVSIAKQFNEDDIQEDADIVGFVFPVYMGDAPWVVKDFVKKINFSANPYIFAVATCNGSPRKCLPIFQKLIEIRMQTLALGEVILMPGNAKISSADENKERLQSSSDRCFTIAQKINNRVEEVVQPDVKLSDHAVIGSPRKKINIAFTHFKTSSKCNGCGICQKICPMGNVEIQEGRPAWEKQCAACLACFHWCPKEAITFRLPLLGNRPRYHHPDIKIQDIVTQQFEG